MNGLDAALRFAREGGPVRREGLIAGAALLVGLLLMPLLVWLAGHVFLGDYANGGPFSLLADFLRGLVRGETAYWIVLAGPYAFLTLGRLLRRLLR